MSCLFVCSEDEGLTVAEQTNALKQKQGDLSGY